MLKIGYVETFAAGENELKPNYIAVLNQPEGTTSPGHLWVKNDCLLEGQFGADDSFPFDRADYILLRVETGRHRDDWQAIESIEKPFQEALADVGKMAPGADTTVADGFVRTAILAAYTSADLSKEDQSLVAEFIRDEYRQAKRHLRPDLEPEEQVRLIGLKLNLYQKGREVTQRPTLFELLDVE